jgi:hypothetical protein
MCAERLRLVSAPAWRIAAKAPATSAITSSAVRSWRAAPAARAIAYSIRRRVSGIMEYYLRYLPKALQDIESGEAVSGGFS